MKAAAIITDGLEPISSKAERPSPTKMGHERTQPEICGNVISYRRDDSQPDGSIEMMMMMWIGLIHTGQITYSKYIGEH